VFEIKIKKIIERLAPGTYRKLDEVKRAIQSFRSSYPNTKILEPIEGGTQRRYYSQQNQDYVIFNELFKNRNFGLFCDIGASHPLKFSNTIIFEENGWTGVAFDPLRGMSGLWQKHRKARFFNLAVSDCEGKVEFCVVDSVGELGSVENMHSHLKSAGGHNLDVAEELISVDVMKLSSILDREKISKIDYMSIDVEGSELNVLRGIDWKNIHIDVISVENNRGEHWLLGDPEIREFVTSKGYSLYARMLGLDDIYVHDDFLHGQFGV